MKLPSLFDAVKRHGFSRVGGRIEDHCDTGEIYAANVITRAEHRTKLDEDKLAEKRRRQDAAKRAAEMHRRLREDGWAREWEGSHGRG